MYYTVRCNVSYNTIIVFYPNLIVVGGGTHDKCAGIVRQDYTGAHIHALGWTFPQELFILRLLRRERYSKLRLARQFLLVLSFETFFIASCLIRPSLHCLIHFSKRLMWLNNNLSNTTELILLDSLFQEVRATEFQIANCLIRLSLFCLIHISKMLGWLKFKYVLMFYKMEGWQLDISCPNLLEKWIKQYRLGRIRKVAISISVAPTSWWSESSNVSLVVLDKLLFSHINLLEKWIKQCKLGRIRQVAI